MATQHSDYSSVRGNAARQYKPEKVNTLLVAEAPPCDEQRYFYFEDVPNKDSLWVELTKFLYEGEFGETKKERKRKGYWLERFCNDGFYLVDAVEDPKVSVSLIRENANRLIRVVTEINPAHIILVKATVYDNLYRPLRKAGLPVINVRVPFPGSGQQQKFRNEMRKAADACNLISR